MNVLVLVLSSDELFIVSFWFNFLLYIVWYSKQGMFCKFILLINPF